MAFTSGDLRQATAQISESGNLFQLRLRKLRPSSGARYFKCRKKNGEIMQISNEWRKSL